MSKIDQTRQSIITALQALSATTGVPSMDVRPAEAVEDVWGLLTRNRMIFVVYGGLDNGPAQQPMGDRKWTPVTQNWIIVTVARSSQGAVTGNTMTGGIDDSVEAIRDVRDSPIGPTGQANSFLRLINEQLITPQERPENGGPVGYAATYRTTQMFV